MNKLNIYLSGATKHVDEDFQNWRSKCFEFIFDGFYTNINFINPIGYFDYTHHPPKTEKQCLDLFMWMVEKSDLVLINLDDSDKSIGTGMEVEHAYCHNIPIIAFGKNKDTWYNWIETRASAVFDILGDAIEYINDYYGNM